jgi:hypothetical protein
MNSLMGFTSVATGSIAARHSVGGARVVSMPTSTAAPMRGSLVVENAHKKGTGSTKNGRDSNPQYRGVKKYGGEQVVTGNIIIRQVGNKVRLERARRDARYHRARPSRDDVARPVFLFNPKT